ncbi:glycerate dehydrogenase [Roseobacter sp. SK209-2-6]|nr:glycerate dehydrogenase [Roseobacter sp. SK209-2-6]
MLRLSALFFQDPAARLSECLFGEFQKKFVLLASVVAVGFLCPVPSCATMPPRHAN